MLDCVFHSLSVCADKLRVKMKTEQMHAEFCVRTFEMWRVKDEEEEEEVRGKGATKDSKKRRKRRRVVRQFQYTAWPDHGVPELPIGVVSFCRMFRKMTRNYLDGGKNGYFRQNSRCNGIGGGGIGISRRKHSVIVHCSAGVGRTGAFLAVMNQTRAAREAGGGGVDLSREVQNLRGNRMKMIQTKEQYSFVYDCLRLTCSRGLDPTPLDLFLAGNPRQEREFPAIMFERLERYV